MLAMDCADYIVDMTLKNGLQITNLQLQKILFVLVAEHMRVNPGAEYPLDIMFKAYDYGPVIPKVYGEYKKYESAPIKSFSVHQKVVFEEGKMRIKKYQYQLNNIENWFQLLVNKHLKQLLNINVFKIVDYTHALPFWKNNWKKIYKHEDVVYSVSDICLTKPLTQLIKTEFS